MGVTTGIGTAQKLLLHNAVRITVPCRTAGARQVRHARLQAGSGVDMPIHAENSIDLSRLGTRVE
jgi:hypothetical protein